MPKTNAAIKQVIKNFSSFYKFIVMDIFYILFI